MAISNPEHPTETGELDRFIHALEAIVAKETDQRKIVAEVEPLVKKLINGDLQWLKEEYRQLPVGKTGVAAGYGQYCLYRRGRELSVVIFCWAPGRGTPIHDHLSWGVLGFIDGCEKETRYRRIDAGTGDLAKLEEVGAVYTEQGQTSHIISPSRDIHRVENPGSELSVSLHVYGCDMGTQKRRRYDLQTGTVEWYTTPHDSDGVIMP